MRPVLVRVGGILFLVALAVWLYCLLDAITAERERVRNLPKGAWIAIVLLLFEIGAIAWLIAGRPRGPADGPRAGRDLRRGTSPRPSLGGPSHGSTRAPGGLGGARPAPDDDPEFLARLDREAAREHERLLGSWEEDLRRREEDLRRRKPEDGTEPEPPTPA